MPLNAAGQFRFRLRPSLYVELEVHDVAVLDDVLLAFLAQLARIAAALFTAERHVVFIAGGLGLDEAALEIRVDNACGLWRLRTDRNGPRTRFGLAGREIALQAGSISESSAMSASIFAQIGTGTQPSISSSSAATASSSTLAT